MIFRWSVVVELLLGKLCLKLLCSLLSLMQQQPQNKDIIDLTKNDVQGAPSAKSYFKKRNGDFSSSPYDD